jgi:hypothetical protein
MVNVIVILEIEPTRVDEFLSVITLNAVESVKEPGCLRFDIVQDADDATHFTLVEMFSDEGAERARGVRARRAEREGGREVAARAEARVGGHVVGVVMVECHGLEGDKMDEAGHGEARVDARVVLCEAHARAAGRRRRREPRALTAYS